MMVFNTETIKVLLYYLDRPSYGALGQTCTFFRDICDSQLHIHYSIVRCQTNSGWNVEERWNDEHYGYRFECMKEDGVFVSSMTILRVFGGVRRLMSVFNNIKNKTEIKRFAGDNIVPPEMLKMVHFRSKPLMGRESAKKERKDTVAFNRMGNYDKYIRE